MNVLQPGVDESKKMKEMQYLRLSSTYVMRAKDVLPKAGDSPQWRGRTTYFRDIWQAWFGDINTGLQYIHGRVTWGLASDWFIVCILQLHSGVYVCWLFFCSWILGQKKRWSHFFFVFMISSREEKNIRISNFAHIITWNHSSMPTSALGQNNNSKDDRRKGWRRSLIARTKMPEYCERNTFIQWSRAPRNHL